MADPGAPAISNDPPQTQLHIQPLPEPEPGYKPVPQTTLTHDGLEDLGWGNDAEHVKQMVHGLDNEETWKLIRRLDNISHGTYIPPPICPHINVLFHVKFTSNLPPGALDLSATPDQEFSPNKFRSQLERLYIGTILGAIATLKHVSRIRSWAETRRTTIFCFAYFTACILDCLVPATLVLLLALTISSRAQHMLFPPAPLSLVSSLSGTLTEPNAGVLGSPDSLTGAPENHRGEAVEHEASNFITALAAIAVNITSGEDPQGEPNKKEDDLRGPMEANVDEIATMMATAKDKAEGVEKPSADKSKKPMETIMWNNIPPTLHALTQINDTWDKVGNLLRPSPPFDLTSQRQILTSILIFFAASSLYISRELVFRSVTFLLGLVIFGDPLIKVGMFQLDIACPDWRSMMSINKRSSNPQLALALLRLGEAQKSPIPPSPRDPSHPSFAPHPPIDETVLDSLGDDLPLGATPIELAAATARHDEKLDEAGGDDVEVSKTNSKEPHRALGLVKGVFKTGVRSAVHADKLRAKMGHTGAKNRVGAVPSGKQAQRGTWGGSATRGPSEFEARWEGRKGLLFIRHNGESGRDILEFRQSSQKVGDEGEVLWKLPIDEIAGLRKHSGYGFKSKLMVGWALDRELNDGLGITDVKGESRMVTAMPRRDVLFNRLIALGKQRWEVW